MILKVTKYNYMSSLNNQKTGPYADSLFKIVKGLITSLF
jgi:hypothetical protein